jgi:hypothetical protein
MAELSYVRQGAGSVRPYIYGPLELPEYIKQTFEAIELERFEFSSQRSR